MENSTEIWKDIEGYEGLYQVSNLGRVKSLERTYICGNGANRIIKEHFISQHNNNRGYLQVILSKHGTNKTCKVHRLVAETFISNPENLPQVDHINGNKYLNTVGNLRWVDNKTNCNNPNTKWKNKRVHTEETKLKMSNSHKGTITKQCLDASHLSHQKEVNKYKNGCLIKTYNSLTEASIDNKVSISAITKSIKRNGTCCGCTWKISA